MKVVSFIYLYEDNGNKVILDLNISNRDLLIFLNGFNNTPYPIERNLSGSGASGYEIQTSNEAYELFQQEWFKKMVENKFGARIIKGKWEDLK